MRIKAFKTFQVMKRPMENHFSFSIPINAREGTLDKRSVTDVKLFLN